LLGEEMGLSLSLSNWTSTERNWHQDEYLNPPHVRAHYLAAWIALEDISPESGPFEFVPGSHRWGLMDRARVQRFLTLREMRSPHWPKLSERILDNVYGRLIEERGAEREQFLGEKGDVLIWHACLAHRGSVPRDREVKRRALICHYTALSKGVAYYPKVGSVPSGGKFFHYGSVD
jgi:ectoine hydroxylase-related dioxygenase (phytanoyl-CoA dioxygenase family)